MIGAFDTDHPDSPARVIVLDVVGLQSHHVDAERTPALHSLLEPEEVADLRPEFPALTVPAQTTLATGKQPREHGDVASGEYDRDRGAVEFWERDRGDRTRIWESASEAGLTTGALFFQHLIGTTADVAVTPSPIEDEDNNILEMNCWTNPDGFYDELREGYDHFPLHNYWGPSANENSTEWILSAARESVDRFDPDLLWVYVPLLDYVGQSDGPESAAFDDVLEVVDDLLSEFLTFLEGTDRWAETAVTVCSEYGFHSVDRPIFPNRALREAGLVSVADDGDVEIPDSEAFAMVDHQVAHVYVDEGARDDARNAFADLEGIDEILEDDQKREYGIDHPDAGDIILVADHDAWFQYYWWEDHDDAPPYASDMDIHKKPGFDPCELFFGDDGLVTLDSTKVSGSHGRIDEDAYGCVGVGGPAAPSLESDRTIDATELRPAIESMLGLETSNVVDEPE